MSRIKYTIYTELKSSTNHSGKVSANNSHNLKDKKKKMKRLIICFEKDLISDKIMLSPKDTMIPLEHAHILFTCMHDNDFIHTTHNSPNPIYNFDISIYCSLFLSIPKDNAETEKRYVT